jgi:hypothetical protein
MKVMLMSEAAAEDEKRSERIRWKQTQQRRSEGDRATMTGVKMIGRADIEQLTE